MKTDYSKQIYDRYYSLSNRTIEFILKNKRSVKGVICGFYRGDQESNEPYVIKWHLIEETVKDRFGTELLGFINGELINQEDIFEVHFQENEKDEQL